MYEVHSIPLSVSEGVVKQSVVSQHGEIPGEIAVAQDEAIGLENQAGLHSRCHSKGRLCGLAWTSLACAVHIPGLAHRHFGCLHYSPVFGDHLQLFGGPLAIECTGLVHSLRRLHHVVRRGSQVRNRNRSRPDQRGGLVALVEVRVVDSSVQG